MSITIENYRAVLFDLDGTIVDNMPVHLATWIELLSEMNVAMTAHEFHNRFAGQTNPAIFKAIFGERFSDADITRMADHKEGLYRERFVENLRPVTGLAQLLDALDARGIPAAVASSGPAINVFFVLDGLGIRQRFKAVVTGEDIIRCKPDPEAFLKTAAMLGIDPADCLVFEDAPAGIESARRAGMDVITLATTMPAEDLHTRPGVIAVCNDFIDAMKLLDIQIYA